LDTGFTENTVNISRELFDSIKSNAVKNNSSLNEFLQSHSSVKQFLSKINYTFNNSTLLMQALTHRSFIHEFDSISNTNNEKLEFVGDSIVGAVVATKLFCDYPVLSEGQLSKFRGALVNEDSLADLGSIVLVPEIVMVGKGEFKTDGYKRPSIISDCFEAIIGAIYFDSSFEKAQSVLEHIFDLYTSDRNTPFISEDRLNDFDSKTKFQELTTKKFKTLPKYAAIQLPDQSFQVTLFVGQEEVATVTDVSKKRAQKRLAQIGLNKL
jgi:ribonuclease-3